MAGFLNLKNRISVSFEKKDYQELLRISRLTRNSVARVIREAVSQYFDTLKSRSRQGDK